MRALLVSPEFPDTYWGFRHALKLTGKRSAFPPLGLLTVSALLPSSWERRLVDMNVRRLRAADLRWADVVLASAMLVQKDALRHVIDCCKALGKRVVVGGPYATTSAGQLSDADHLFLGEAEATLPAFARDLERGEARRVYQAETRPPLSATPVPDFGLADLRRYSAMSLQYSRGCPFDCEFWRYLGRVRAEHRERFSQAMALAAQGYHLRTLTELSCDESSRCCSATERVPS